MSLLLSCSTTVVDLCRQLALKLDIPVWSQQLFVAGQRLPLFTDEGSPCVLKDVGLRTGTHVEVMCSPQFCPLLPPRFRILLHPVPGEVVARGSSDVFSYSMKVDMNGNTVTVEIVGNYQTDVGNIDTLAGTMDITRGHWYIGPTYESRDLGTEERLPKVFERWCSRLVVVTDDSACLWRRPSRFYRCRSSGIAGIVPATPRGPRPVLPCLDSEGSVQEDRYLRGRFRAPDAGCTEFLADVSLPGRGFGLGEHVLARVLVNADGLPVRAAICAGLKTSLFSRKKVEVLEEWSVTLQIL